MTIQCYQCGDGLQKPSPEGNASASRPSARRVAETPQRDQGDREHPAARDHHPRALLRLGLHSGVSIY